MADVARVPLDDIRPSPGNAKSHDLDLIIASLRRFGFADPLVVDQRTGELLAGHGRAEALRVLRALAASDEVDPETGEAYRPPDGIGDDWRVPVYVGWSSSDDAEAEAARIALNRTTEAGGWDEVRLLDALDRLAGDGGLVGVGFDDSEIDELREQLDALDDAGQVNPEGSGDLLAVTDVTGGPPKTEVSRGDTFRLDEIHLLVVEGVFDGHHAWRDLLTDDHLLVPYPEPYVTLTPAAQQPLLLVQPDTYLAAHLLDRHKEARGDASVVKVDR